MEGFIFFQGNEDMRSVRFVFLNIALAVLFLTAQAQATDVKLGEEWVYKIRGRTLTIQGGDIANFSYTSSSTLAVALWASTRPLESGGGKWYRLGWTKFKGLRARTYYSNFRRVTTYKRPRSGRYYITLSLYEASGRKWAHRSSLTWGGRKRL